MNEYEKDPTCPNGAKDPQEACDCSKAPGWVAGKWKDPWCYKGRCFTGQEFKDCDGKEDGHPIGDGTWCFKSRRDTECPAHTGKA